MDKTSNALPDVQNLMDGRNIPIDRVGIRGLTVPLQVQSVKGAQPTVANVCMCVGLPADKRGTHMSRFVSLIADNHAPLSSDMMRETLEKMLTLLEAEEGYIEISCPFFVTKTSPMSKLKSLMNYDVRFLAERVGGKTRVIQEVTVPVTSLCPCSREISDYGAHNQRSHIVVTLELSEPISLEEQIRFAETSASCELWSRLKRNDEKYVTEFAYDHPKFVEDIIRDVCKQLNADERVLWYRAEAENFESIHNHSAYATISRDKRLA